MHIHFVDSATKVEIAPRDQVLINGARFVQVILDHNVGRGMAPVDPTDHVQFETLDVNIKEKVVILPRYLDIGKADDFDICGYNGLDIVVNVSRIIFPAESIPLDPIFNNVPIKTSLSMGPIVGGAVAIHLVRDTRLDEIYWRTTAGHAASNIQDSYVWVVRIEIPQFRVIVRDRFDKNRSDVSIRAVDKKSPERVTHYAIVCSDLNDARFLPRTEVSFVKISQGARSGEHAGADPCAYIVPRVRSGSCTWNVAACLSAQLCYSERNLKSPSHPALTASYSVLQQVCRASPRGRERGYRLPAHQAKVVWRAIQPVFVATNAAANESHVDCESHSVFRMT